MKQKMQALIEQSVKQWALVALVAGLAFLAGLGGTEMLTADLITTEDCPDDAVCNGDFRAVLINFINYFLGFVGLIAVAFIIYAGLLMIIAGGEEEQVEKGRKIIIWASVGIIIILLSFAIVNFVVDVGESAS